MDDEPNVVHRRMPLHDLHAGLLAAPLLLALWSFRGPLQRSGWPALAAIVYFGGVCARGALANIRAPQAWDFGCFWLYGHIAAAHQNIYDPSVFAHFPLPFTPSDDFVQAVINVGFPYPPPTIALFLPLGYISSVSASLAVWYVVQFAALAIAAWLLARTFMPTEGWPGTALVLALTLALPATQTTVGYAQTNFLLLLLIALTLRTRSTAGGAVWQMLAVWVKPFAAALLLVDLVRGNWRRLAIAAVTAAASLIAAALVLGPQTLLTYFRSNPAGREPASTFSESVNQSLLAVVLRAHHVTPAHVSALHEPMYVAVAALLLAVTVVLCMRAPRDSDLALALALLLGLLIYPATLNSYGVVLVVPLLVLWRHRDALPGKTGAGAAVALIALVTILQGYARFDFGANLALWICTAGVLAAQIGSLTASTSPAVFRTPGAATPASVHAAE